MHRYSNRLRLVRAAVWPRGFDRSNSGLKVELPVERPCDYAYVLKISLKGKLLGHLK